MSAYLLGLGFRADMGTCVRKLVLLKLIDACEDDGRRIFPAVATVARAAQCSPRQVQREIAAFQGARLIRLVKAGGRGPRSTNEYAMDLDVLGAIAREGWDAYVASLGPDEAVVLADVPDADAAPKGDTQSPLDDGAKGDAGVAPRVTAEADKGDSWSHTTPPDPSLEPSVERERGREGPKEDQPRDDQPGTAAFDKRVMRFCSGRGFLAGAWPNWDTGAAPGWIARQFAKLTPKERMDAERWRDAYLLDVRARGKDPVAPGNFLSGKLWQGLEPAVLERAEKHRQAQLPAEERARPDGWAASLGPVGMAWLFATLLAGQPGGTVEPGGLWLASRLRRDWPAIHGWNQRLQMHGGMQFGERWHGLKDAMEAVPKGSEVYAAWKASFATRGWPWLSGFDGPPDVLWAPKGGPEGLAAFGEAVARKDHDGREAAE